MYGESQYYTPYEQDVPYGQAHNMPPQQPMQPMQGLPQQPYGMGQDTPQPMGMMSAGQQGFPNMGSPFTNNSMSQQNFAKGGRVTAKHLRMAVEELRRQGDGRDQILAHISPQEAMELAQRHGGNVNQKTGLPQFGWWQNFWDNTVGENVGNFVEKYALPATNFLGKTLATAAGTMLGGPLGGVLGGTLAGGGLEANEENPNYGRGLLGGAMHGGLQAFGGPMLGKALGVTAGGTAGTLMGMSAPKLGMLGSSLGLGLGASNAAGAAAGRSAAYGGLANVGKAAGAPAAGAGGGGILSSIFGGGAAAKGAEGAGGGLLDKALLATALLGTLGAKKEVPKEPSMQDMINGGPKWGPEHQARDIQPYKRDLKYFDPNNYTPGFVPEQLYYNEVNPVAKYATGGHVRAFQGHGGGQSDKIPVGLPEEGYVIDASTSSDLGDGNPDAGAEKMNQYIEQETRNHYKKGGTTKSGLPKKTVPAMVSPKEIYIEPEDVTNAFGKGSNVKGAKNIEKLVKNVSKHKRSSPKGLPPKAKNIKAYLGSK